MLFILIACAIVAADQITKALIRTYLEQGQEVNIIDGFLKIVHVENSGAAFGLLEGQTRFLLLVPAVIVIFAVFAVTSKRFAAELDTGLKVSIIMVAAGGIGNLIDRILFSSVTDMISFSIFPPVFNVADIAVTLGCAFLIISVIRKRDHDG